MEDARTPDQADQRELLLRLLPMTASLAGFCIASITLFRLNERWARVETLADDLLAICVHPRLLSPLSRVVDATFLMALSLLVAVGFMMVYNIL